MSLAAVALAVAVTSTASADDQRNRGLSYEVTITNLTAGQVLTPALLIAHNGDFALFHVGDAATPGLATLAESGNPGPAQSEATNTIGVYWTGIDYGGLIPPGQSRTVMVEAHDDFNEITIAGMLANTNDTFYSIHGAMLPEHGSRTLYAMAYDAGSEKNTEACSDVPGPACPMSGHAHVDEEVAAHFVHVSNGIHGIADLKPAMTDWRGPVAMIEIHPIR